MVPFTSAEIPTCKNCGQPVAGKFCGSCGMAVAEQDSKGAISMLVGELGGPPGQGYLYTLATILRSPVRATLALTENKAYRGHKSFLLASLTVGIAVQSYVARNDPSLANQPELQDFIREYGDYYSILLTAFQYITIFAGFLLGYWFYKRFSSVPRTAQAYFRLTCLSGGLTALLGAVFSGIQFLGMGSPDMLLWLAPVYVPLMLFMIYYGLKVQKLFWNFSYPKLIALSLLLGIFVVIGLGLVSAAVFFAFALVYGGGA